MGGLLDKLILFLCCVLLLPLQAFSPWCLAALLAALCLSSLNSYFPEKFSFSSRRLPAAGIFSLYSFSLL